MMTFKRLGFALSISAIVAANMSAQTNQYPTFAFEGRDAATVGVLIIDLASGKTIASENADRAMIPASIMKAVTTASALLKNGTDFTYRTPVTINGSIGRDGTLAGDVVIEACGDPTIGSAYFKETAGFADSIVSSLQCMGVKEILGGLEVDESSFPEPGQNPQWVIEDAGWAYGTGVYGFNWCDNIFKYYPSTGRSVPTVPDIDVILEPSASSTDIAHGINSNLYIVSGKDLSRDNYYVTTTMDSPAAAFLYTLRSKLKEAGINVREGNPASASGQRRIVFTQQSPSNREILRSLMFRSDNMMAEATLRSLSPGKSRTAAIKAEKEIWTARGVSSAYAKIADGSGLARVDRVTPRFMADVLKSMAESRYSSVYAALFPKAGKEGTVKSFLKGTPLDGRLALKSGSMNGVHCYAGYKLDTQGKPTHVVVVMVNNFFCSRDALRKAISAYLVSKLK